MDNVTELPRRDLIAEMTGPKNVGNALWIEGRLVPGINMIDRGGEIEFVIDHRASFSVSKEWAWVAAAFAFAAMAYGAGCDPLNFEPRPFAKKLVNLGNIDGSV